MLTGIRQRSFVWAEMVLLFLANPGTSAARSSVVLPLERDCIGCEPAASDNTGPVSMKNGNRPIQERIRHGEDHQARGDYGKAAGEFTAALEAARMEGDALLEVTALQSLGYVFLLQGAPETAEPLLRSALEKAEILGRPALIAACANRLGNVSVREHRWEEAYTWYRKALDSATAADDPGLEAAVLKNMAHILENDKSAAARLRAAEKAARRVPFPGERAWLFLEIAHEAKRRLAGKEAAAFQYRLLHSAYTLFAETGEDRLRSLAAGSLGTLYADRERRQEAIGLFGEAIEAAQQIDAHDLLLKWEWQMARAFRAQGQRQKALAALKRAVYHIQAIRQDIPIRYPDGSSSFQKTLAPIYYGLADILLEQAAEETDDSSIQNLLREARDTIEQIKRSEMRDYFRDPCIVAQSRTIETVSSATAVLYPIIMPDRLELLTDIGGRLFRKTAPVSRVQLQKTVAALAGDLRNRSDFTQKAATVFDWLIRPVLPLLEERQVDTVVFVPDGALRMVPIAALWDGDRFLVERFAVATVPGLTLLDPKPLPRKDMNTLLAGMSEPGPVILNLPENLWEAYRRIDPAKIERGLRGLETVTQSPPSVPDAGDAARPRKNEDVEHVKNVLALPGVSEEIEKLSRKVKGQVLMNGEFQIGAFSSEFREKPYRLVHIASHGFFGGAPEQNFIMTYDKLLTMNQLEDLVKTKQMAELPVELLTLSACQTAEGDERSPMGLTGVALKSGARSALGSLWPVSDNAAQQLFPAFYSHLESPNTTKAQALRRAQIELMQQPEFRHPFYWSPFILAGNWL